jgi:hypothetical protein
MNTSSMARSTPSIQLRRIWWVGPLTVLAAILGVLVVRVIAVAILRPDPLPMSLRWSTPAVFTFVLVTGAVLVFALVAALVKKQALRVYQVIALVVLLLSFLPDIGYASSPMPGASWPVAIALMIMHVVAAAITVVMLTKLTLAPAE